MAQTALRLRRALSLTTSLLSHRRTIPTTTLPSLSALLQALNPHPQPTLSPLRHFHSSVPTLSPAPFNDMDKIDPDTILFEGCDFNHWLIVMDFGNDPAQRPPPEQMVDTYVQTAATIFGSVEEAKKRIYACSTTTYCGFQVEVDEETSKKFEGLPGVIFVLPDSYIDPVNKEYGGDKYINGVIIPRPPPVQYGRPRRGRQNDSMPRGPPPYQQRNPANSQHGSMSGDGRGYMPQGPQQGYPQQQTFSPQQNFTPQQNYGPSGQGGMRNHMPSGTHLPDGGRGSYQSGQNNYVPPHQKNYNHGDNHHQNQMPNHLRADGGYASQGQLRGHPADGGHNTVQGQMTNSPGGPSGYVSQGQMDSSPRVPGGYVPQGFPGDNRSSNPPSSTIGAYDQVGTGSFEQRGAGQYGPGSSGSYIEGSGTGYGLDQTSHGENQRFSQTSENRSYSPVVQNGINQGRC